MCHKKTNNVLPYTGGQNGGGMLLFLQPQPLPSVLLMCHLSTTAAGPL